jgi:hypothetical protein
MTRHDEKGGAMQQIAMFPLSDVELKKKAKELAAKIRQLGDLETGKEASAKAFKHDIQRTRREMLGLAKEIEDEQEQREATDEEAPWKGLLDRMHEKAGKSRRRDRTEEVAEDGE